MMKDDNGKFKAGKFQGRVEESLANIADDIVEIKEDVVAIREEAGAYQRAVREEMKGISEKVHNNRLKIAGIGATISFIVTILVLLMRELIGK